MECSKKSDLGFMLQYGPILAVLNTMKTNTRIRIFHTRVSLDISYSSRFVQYPHYPIACCLPHLSTVAHNCHGRSINLTAKRKRVAAKRITSPCGKKKRLATKIKTSRQKGKRVKAKREPHGKKKKTRGKIYSMPRGHFNSYFFCREVVVILFAVRFFFLL